MARGRGRPRRAEDTAEYLWWRRAESSTAERAGPWPAEVDEVAEAMGADPATVTRWRRSMPTPEVWRAWLHRTYDSFEGMAAAIDRGAFDHLAGPTPGPARTHRDYLAEVVPQLAAIEAARSGRRATTASLAALLGVSRRTVGRHRTD